MTDQAQVTPAAASPSGASSDVQLMMAYDAQKKSMTTAILLWLFTGGVGGHNWYLGRTGPAVGQLVLCILSWVTLIVVIGAFGLAALGIWLIIDVCMLSGWVRQHNLRLAQRLGMASPIY